MIKRRGFLKGLAATIPLGVAAAIVRNKPERPDPRANPEAFRLDLDQYSHVDPGLLGYRENPPLVDGLKGARAMSMAPDGTLYLSAGKMVLRLTENHEEVFAEGEGQVTAVGASGDDCLWMAMGPILTRYDAAGQLKGESVHLGERGYVTAIAPGDKELFVADAGQKTIWVFSSDGRLRGCIDGRSAGDTQSGFVIPSPWFHVTAGSGELWVTNPGRQRVERYVDGLLIESWGLPAMSVDGFCGCCNPTHLALLPGGGFVTSEKGIPRVKVYNRDGEFSSVVAGADAFDEDTTGLAVAAASNGRIFVLDPVRGQLRVFTPKAQEGGA